MERDDTIEQNKNFSNRSCESRVMTFSSWPMIPSFVYITIFGLMIVTSRKLKLTN